MTGLGNIFEPVTEGPRGPDLKFLARVPRRALGRPGGISVRVPAHLPTDTGLVPRARSGHDDRDSVQLHLPEDLPKGAILRLRGQGGVLEGAAPGDLYVQVEVLAPSRWPLILVGLGLFAAGVLGILYG